MNSKNQLFISCVEKSNFNFEELNFKDNSNRNKQEIQEEIYKKAYTDGFEKGYKDSILSFSTLINNLKLALSRINESISLIRDEFEKDVLKISFAIAEKILNCEIEKEKYLEFIKRYFESYKKEDTKIVLSKSNFEKIKELSPDLFEEMGKIIEFLDDIEEDDVFIKNGNFMIKINPSEQLKILKEKFIGNSNENN